MYFPHFGGINREKYQRVSDDLNEDLLPNDLTGYQDNHFLQKWESIRRWLFANRLNRLPYGI